MWEKIKKILTEIFVDDERKRIEDYLSEAQDIYDLEYRQRQVDRQKFKF